MVSNYPNGAWLSCNCNITACNCSDSTGGGTIYIPRAGASVPPVKPPKPRKQDDGFLGDLDERQRVRDRRRRR